MTGFWLHTINMNLLRKLDNLLFNYTFNFKSVTHANFEILEIYTAGNVSGSVWILETYTYSCGSSLSNRGELQPQKSLQQ